MVFYYGRYFTRCIYYVIHFSSTASLYTYLPLDKIAVNYIFVGNKKYTSTSD